jgi:GTPase
MLFNNLLIDPYTLPKESEEDSCVEYKRQLINISNMVLEKRISQMLKRLYDGYIINDKMMCTYLLGVNDDGSIYGLDKKDRKKTLKNLKKMVSGCNATIHSYHIRKIKGCGYILQVNITSDLIPQEFIC